MKSPLLWAATVFLCSSAVAGWLALGLFPFVQIRENSMAPALVSGDLVLLDRTAYLWNRVWPGDVLIFDIPALSARPKTGFQSPNRRRSANRIKGLASQIPAGMIKRCALPPKMPLQWRGSQLYIPARQGYVEVDEPVRKSLAGLARVPEGFIFVLGDNLAHSLDSRNYGLVPLAQVRGKAIWLKRDSARTPNPEATTRISLAFGQ